MTNKKMYLYHRFIITKKMEEEKRKRCTHRFKYQHETKNGLYLYKCSKCKKTRWLEKAIEDIKSLATR